MFVAGGKLRGDLLLSALRSHRGETHRGDPGGQKPEEHGHRRSFRSDPGDPGVEDGQKNLFRGYRGFIGCKMLT